MDKILFIILIPLFHAGCIMNNEVTLSDFKSKDDLIEYNKTKQAQKDFKEGQNLVNEFKANLPKKTPEELIGMFVTESELRSVSPPPKYYLYRDGNEEIKNELRRRGKSIVSTLIKYQKDNRTLFTGDNGDLESIGSVCSELLEEIDKNPNQ